jgi:hypothetical protein
VAGPNRVASGISAFDQVAADYANGNEMLAEYWHRRAGITRHVMAHIHEHFENNRDTLGSEASRAMATRRSIEEQKAISLLITAEATAEYRGGMSVVEAREAIDQQAGIFDMDDIFIDN